ncbi:MAG: hypothetical protein WC809_08130 [Sinimarinibacterium sp.]
MLRIYDDAYLTRRTRLRRLQVLVLFVGGVLCGSWLSTAGHPLDLLPTATAAKPVAAQQTPAWCGDSGATTLRLDCELKLPALRRAEDV